MYEAFDFIYGNRIVGDAIDDYVQEDCIWNIYLPLYDTKGEMKTANNLAELFTLTLVSRNWVEFWTIIKMYIET